MKKIIIVLCFAALSTGCAAPQRMNIHDLCTFKTDCSKKEEQIQFLKTQIPTSDERMMSALGMNVFTEISAALKGEKSQAASTRDREYDLCAKMAISDLEQSCPNKTQSDYEDNVGNGVHDLRSH